jgi:pimeloyl-ACP methyl ester carboxylesterase
MRRSGRLNWFTITIGLILALGVLYFLGPKPATPEFSDKLPAVPTDPVIIEDYLRRKESRYDLRPDNQAQIIWADSAYKRTPYVILYLHGFSASQGEGAPVHSELAQKYGANLLLSRLAGHGLKSNNLADFSAESAWFSAKEAFALARGLGDSVIVMGTSTGCTLGLMLASQFGDSVKALVNLSPNIRVNNPAAFLLNDPWGKQIAHSVIGEYRRVKADTPAYALYWDTLYTTNAVIELQSLLENAMVRTNFKRIEQPTLNLFYYASEQEQDQVVRVDKILWMDENLSTPDSLKRAIALAEPANHVLASPIKSKNTAVVAQEINSFFREILKMPIVVN